MKRKNILFLYVALIISCLFTTEIVYAADFVTDEAEVETYDFYIGAGLHDDLRVSLNTEPLKKAILVFQAHDGNKLRLGYIWSENWLSDVVEPVSTGTIKASDNSYIYAFIPENSSCEAEIGGVNAICIKVPSKYSSNGSGNDIGETPFVGFRFTNESWFYGDVHVWGSLHMFY